MFAATTEKAAREEQGEEEIGEGGDVEGVASVQGHQRYEEAHAAAKASTNSRTVGER